MSGRVLVIGAGPAGLAAATRLARSGVAVTVLEREREAGGVPRHCAHQGFGLRDLRRSLDGPRYAARRVALARAAGAQLRTGIQVTGWVDQRTVVATSQAGREELGADAVLLATGCRERPRPARLIPGDRCGGVMTTGMLQQLVAAGRPVGRRALVVGAEHVSYSALATLRHAGVEIAGMVTELDRPQTFAAFTLGAAAAFGTRAWTQVRVSRIEGESRVQAVDVTDARGQTRRIECDTVVLTADWIPERELAVAASLEIARGTGGPEADGCGRTSRPGIFAAGNVLHGAEPADRAALEGERAAAAIGSFLRAREWPDHRPATRVRPPLRWGSPSLHASDAPAPLLLRCDERLLLARLVVRQDGRTLSTHRLARVAPGRGAVLGAGWDDGADPSGGQLTVEIATARPGR